MPQNQLIFWGIDIPWPDTVGYLGVTLDKKLNFGTHVTSCLCKCDMLIKTLYPLINRRSRLDPNIKLLLYKTVFRPTVTYGFPAWSNCPRSHRKNIQVKLMMLNLHPSHPTDEVHQLAKIELVDDWFLRLMPKFRLSCFASDNPLIQEIGHLELWYYIIRLFLSLSISFM